MLSSLTLTYGCDKITAWTKLVNNKMGSWEFAVADYQENLTLNTKKKGIRTAKPRSEG